MSSVDLDHRRDAAAACDGKIGYQSWIIANKAMRRIRRAKHIALELYRCRRCGCWHIGGRL